MGHLRTRRELGAGAAVALAVALGAQTATAAGSGDADELESILELEQLAVYGYERVLASGALGAAARQVASDFLAHEREHVTSLDTALASLGGSAPAAPTDPRHAGDLLSAHGGSGSFSDLHSEHDCLQLLVSVENAVIGGYFASLSTLSDPALIRPAAEIMAAEGQHAAILGELLYHGDVKKAVPSSFVEGTQ